MTVLTAKALERVADRLREAEVSVEGQLRSRLIAGGRSNLTYRLEDDANAWVLRTPPRVGRTPSAHDVAREHRVMRALQGTDVPVPEPVLFCDDDSVIGVPFTVTQFISGRTIRSRTDLDGLGRNTIVRCVDRLVETLASLHAVDHVAVGLEDFGRPTGYPLRQLRRWAGQWNVVGTAAHDRMGDELSARLGELCPEQGAVSVVHGDFRIDNTLLTIGSRSRTRVEAVVDWELSTIGDPVADVAMMCAYRHPALDLVLGQESAWTSPEIPDRDALAVAYESLRGVRLHHWEFYLGLAYFKVAVIAAGIDHRFRSGATTGPGFDTATEAVPQFLSAGLESVGARA